MAEKQLHRSRDDRMLGGVCGGIAEYLDMDPTIVRLLAVLITLVGNVAAVIAYLVMWIAVPEGPSGAALVAAQGRDVTMSEGTERSNAPGPVPDAPPPPPPPPRHATAGASPAHHETASGSGRGRGGVWFGAILVLVGVALLVQIFIPAIRLWEFWPVIIIVAGVLMILRSGGGGAR